jgi:hypothetical protein
MGEIKHHWLCILYFILFPRTPLQTNRAIFTHDGSNDAVSRKEVPLILGGLVDTTCRLRELSSKIPHFWCQKEISIKNLFTYISKHIQATVMNCSSKRARRRPIQHINKNQYHQIAFKGSNF